MQACDWHYKLPMAYTLLTSFCLSFPNYLSGKWIGQRKVKADWDGGICSLSEYQFQITADVTLMDFGSPIGRWKDLKSLRLILDSQIFRNWTRNWTGCATCLYSGTAAKQVLLMTARDTEQCNEDTFFSLSLSCFYERHADNSAPYSGWSGD